MFVLATDKPCKRKQIFQERHTFNIPFYLLFLSFSCGAHTLPKWKQSGTARPLKKSLLGNILIFKFREHWGNNKQTKPQQKEISQSSFFLVLMRILLSDFLLSVFQSEYLMESLETFYYMNPSDSGLK